MDNDKKLVKSIKKSLKKIHFSIEYANKNIASEEEGNKLIYDSLRDGKPLAVMRLGASETNCAYPWMTGSVPSQEILDRGKYAAGIFPSDAEHNSEFAEVYLNAIKSADIMALWGVYKEKKIVDTYCPDAKFIKAKSIEPYYFDEPWTQVLQGKKLLVVHPFVDTIKKQFDKRLVLFEGGVLPKQLELKTVKAVQSNAGAIPEYKSWNDALKSMKDKIETIDFDIAIIGAGAYGLPLTAYCKEIGKQAVQMSGATQILFGIMGKRWDDHPYISKLYNEHWVRPMTSETPPEIEKVEGGSYW